MTKSEVRNLIYEGLKGMLEAHGFRLNRKQEGFVRKIPDGKQCIGGPRLHRNKPEPNLPPEAAPAPRRHT